MSDGAHRPTDGCDEKPKKQSISAVDVFCGIGGLTRGLLDAGISVGAGVDIDSTCRYAYEANNANASFIEADVREISFDDLESHYDPATVRGSCGVRALSAVLGTYAGQCRH